MIGLVTTRAGRSGAPHPRAAGIGRLRTWTAARGASRPRGLQALSALAKDVVTVEQ